MDGAGYADLRTGRLVGVSAGSPRDALEAVIGGAIERAAALDRIWADTPTDVLILEELT